MATEAGWGMQQLATTTESLLRQHGDELAQRLMGPFQELVRLWNQAHGNVVYEMRNDRLPSYYTHLAVAVAYWAKFNTFLPSTGWDKKSNEEGPDSGLITIGIEKLGESAPFKENGIRLWDAGLRCTLPPNSTFKDYKANGIWTPVENKGKTGYICRAAGEFFKNRVVKAIFPDLGNQPNNRQNQRLPPSPPPQLNGVPPSPPPQLNGVPAPAQQVNVPAPVERHQSLGISDRLGFSLQLDELIKSGSWDFVKQFAYNPGLARESCTVFFERPPLPRQALRLLRAFFFKMALHGTSGNAFLAFKPKQNLTREEKEGNLAAFLDHLNRLDPNLEWKVTFQGFLLLVEAVAQHETITIQGAEQDMSALRDMDQVLTSLNISDRKLLSMIRKTAERLEKVIIETVNLDVIPSFDIDGFGPFAMYCD